jgi:hypothetical protein
MRTVEFNQAMSGLEGAQFAAPSPRAPHPCSCCAIATLCWTLDTNDKKGTLLIS